MAQSVQVLLGTVIGKLEGIGERLDRQDASRAVLHTRVDELVERTVKIENEFHATKEKIEAMEQVTVEVKTLRTKAEGAGTLGRWLIGLGGWVISAAVALVGFYTWLTGRPPP
ncbi:MAG: hypothetical protein CML31_14695 [Rhizobiales bacterium]|nr:hypothetical protein [Hyphomicrobiales bacterium]|tara:strand:+ start:2525 stop:2863 length:339 start_codon:yes stop_codon:yes gene_type:complete